MPEDEDVAAFPSLAAAAAAIGLARHANDPDFMPNRSGGTWKP